MRKLTEIIKELLSGVAQIVWGTVSLAWRVPIALVRGAFGGGGQQTVQQSSADIQQAAEEKKATEQKQSLEDVVRAILDRANGRQPDQETMSRLSEMMHDYAVGLTDDECRVLAKQSNPGAVMRKLASGQQIDGIRNPLQVAADLDRAQQAQVEAEAAREVAAPLPSREPETDQKAARRLQLRGAVQGAAKAGRRKMSWEQDEEVYEDEVDLAP